MLRVGQNHIYTVYIQYFWQGNQEIYGHTRCIYTVLANPTHAAGPPFGHGDVTNGAHVGDKALLEVRSETCALLQTTSIP